jgi:hypothetical protein
MSFQVTHAEYTAFPDDSAAREAAMNMGTSIDQLCDLVQSFISQTDTRPNIGHQQVLAPELERHFERSLRALGFQTVSKSVSPVLGERVDFAVGRGNTPPYLLGEIEFRPNFEKDLVKFSIAARRGILGLGVLLVAKDRREVNPGYTSMPQYEEVIRTVAEFAPTFPLVVIGLSGELR